MGFADRDLSGSVRDLSGGEKTRFALAKLLCLAPDVLLLDEPTNHLDFETRQWLEGYLKGFSGAIVVVSHDRYFLDSCCDSIAEVRDKKYTVTKAVINPFCNRGRRHWTCKPRSTQNSRKRLPVWKSL